MVDFTKLAEKAVAAGRDMSVAVAGGGDYTPPPEGPCRVRFIGYVEVGKQKKKMKGIEQIVDSVQLVFEVHGKNYPVHVADDGTKTPVRITIDEKLSLNEKANFYKLFMRMNPTGEVKHMAALLGRGYKAQIFHDKWTDRSGKERITPTFKGPDGYSIAPARVEDDEVEGGWRNLEVPPAISPIRCFLWEHADMEQWQSLFIDGEYPKRTVDGKEIAAKSKNVFQNKVKSAVNFPNSPMYVLLVSNGAGIDLPEPEGEEDEGKPDTPTGVAGTVGEVAASSTTSPSNDALTGIC